MPIKDINKLKQQIHDLVEKHYPTASESDGLKEESEGDYNCPNCGREYDEIDYEYQICHYCGYRNNTKNKHP